MSMYIFHRSELAAAAAVVAKVIYTMIFGKLSDLHPSFVMQCKGKETWKQYALSLRVTRCAVRVEKKKEMRCRLLDD